MSRKDNFIMYTCYHEDFDLDANDLLLLLALHEEDAWDELVLLYESFGRSAHLPAVPSTDLDDPRDNRSLKERLYDIGWRIREVEMLVSNFDLPKEIGW